MMTKDEGRTTKDLPVSLLVVRLSSVNKNRALSSKDEERARGATLVCRNLTAPASTVYADPASLREAPARTYLQLGGRKQACTPTGWAQPRSSGVSFLGCAGGICSDCRSLDCAISLVLSPSTLLADVRMCGRIPRGVRSVKTDFWPIQMTQARKPTPQGCRTAGLAHRRYLRLTQLNT